MPSLATVFAPLSSSSAVVLLPLLAALFILPLGRFLGWPSLFDFLPLVLGLAAYLFKVHPVLGFFVITFFSLFAFTALALSDDADVSILLVVPWLVAQACLWKYTSYGWYAYWAASIAIIVKNYGTSPPVWCIPQILVCLWLKELFSYYNEEHVRQFGYSHIPNCVTYIYEELQELEWSLDMREIKDLLLLWGDRSAALFRRVAGIFTTRPASPAGPAPLPPSPAELQPTPQESGPVVLREKIPVEEAAESKVQAPAPRTTSYAPFRGVQREYERKYGQSVRRPVAPGLTFNAHTEHLRLSRFTPFGKSLSQPFAKPFVPPKPLSLFRVKERRRPWVPMKPEDFKRYPVVEPQLSLTDKFRFPGEDLVPASTHINGAPIIGPFPIPLIAGPQIPPVQPYEPLFHNPTYGTVVPEPEWEPQVTPPQIQSVVVYNPPAELYAAPAVDQPIAMCNLDGTTIYPEDPEGPADISMEDEDEEPSPVDNSIPMEKDEEQPAVMSVEDMEGFLAQPQTFQSTVNANANIPPVDYSGYESFDDTMDGSPYNNCKIRTFLQAPVQSQFQPMVQPAITMPAAPQPSGRPIAKPKSVKPRALRSSSTSSSSSLSSLEDVERRLASNPAPVPAPAPAPAPVTYNKFMSKYGMGQQPSVASSSTSQGLSLGATFQGLQSSMYNVPGPVSKDLDMLETPQAPQMPSSQALPPAMQPKTTPSKSPLAMALSQMPLQQVPFLGQPMPTATPAPSVPSISQLSVPQMPLPQVPFNVPTPVLSPLPPTPSPLSAKVPLPFYGLMPATPPTPTPQPKSTQVLPPLKPQQTTQQKPSLQAVPNAPKAQTTVPGLTWPTAVSEVAKPPQVAPQMPAPQVPPAAPPAAPKPPKVSSQLALPEPEPILVTIQESSEPDPVVKASQAQMSGRRVAVPKSRKAMTSINPYQGTDVVTSSTSGNAAMTPKTNVQAPAPKPPQPLCLPGKSKPTNPASTITTTYSAAGPSDYKGKGPATNLPELSNEPMWPNRPGPKDVARARADKKIMASPTINVDKVYEFEDKVVQFEGMGYDQDVAIGMANDYFDRLHRSTLSRRID
ncbi:hypothetical protein K445DRAFT_8275 [Daldinia sp. EC12]|nr:hypothetical protein K445DRAFT_8275 [Daldinia sp. EC12]